MKKYQDTAVIICDMWDQHWCKSAAQRVRQMTPRMNALAGYLRENGAAIVHCPSETLAFYAGSPALARTGELARGVELKPDAAWAFRLDRLPPLGVDPDRVECDCGAEKCPQGAPWTRQTEGIEIAEGDLMGEDESVLKALQALGIKKVLIMGVHTNLCVMNRPFGIKNMLRHGFKPTLVRDMTDSMAPSDQPPYENHFNAHEQVVRYIERNLCPTTTSGILMDDNMLFSFSEDPNPGRFWN